MYLDIKCQFMTVACGSVSAETGKLFFSSDMHLPTFKAWLVQLTSGPWYPSPDTVLPAILAGAPIGEAYGRMLGAL